MMLGEKSLGKREGAAMICTYLAYMAYLASLGLL
jgi:hypothetical protein